MCEKKQPKSKDDGGRYCVIDHANKRGDRERPNPNRTLIGRLRAGSPVLSGDIGPVARPDGAAADGSND